ncbi:MAG TPA: glycosyl hydrolase [Gemmatimonadaceae bacterium]|nr:glycosyl hydrolase [Gemmatimonadaceae bacterium]
MAHRSPPPADHSPTSPPPDAAEDSAVSRRNFFVRAGQIGGALAVFGPTLGRTWMSAPPAAAAAAPLLTSVGQHPNHAALADLFSGLRWRMLGPFRGGRTDAVCGVHGRPNEFYFGSVNGGVWKTVDAGRVWFPVFDGQPVASIGALCVAPSAPDTVYVGTGESTLRDSMGYGNGVYKTTDGGKSWTHVGLDETQHIGKIAVDPRNPNVVFVAAIGHLYAPNAERGVFRSRDGGKTWQKVLYKDENVGAVEVVIDPTNSNVVYAGLWNTRRPPWYTYRPSNGPGGGIYKSTDGGTTWKQLTNGLPSKDIGKSGIAVAPSDPKRVYAVMDVLPDQGGFFRSDDGGASWTKLSSDQALWGRGWYFEHVAVDPHDANRVYVSNVAVSRSSDGGHSWVALRGSPGGDDYHQPWVSPDDPNTMIVASDQGTIITRNARADDPKDVTWSSWLNQPTAQVYHVSVDYRSPYWVTGAQQDSGAVAVRSRGKFGEISMRDWEPIGAGGESGMTAGDPLHPGVIYGGTGSRFDLGANAPIPGTTSPVTQGDDRADWTQPLVLSQADPRALYYASQYLYKSTDGARTWKKLSPDLTRPDPGVPSTLDAATAEDTDRNAKRGVIYTVAPSPLLVPMVWIGTDDGFIQLTTNDGKTWQNVTPSAMTSWSRVTTIEASHFDYNTAYASVDRHQLQDFDPYIYRTRDMGKTWQRITTGLPAGVYVHVVREDPARQGLLFAGTERGVFISFDDGDHWQPFQQNLPATSNRDFQIYGNDLIVATHGRGFWVVDDISALRQLTPAMANEEAILFKPADALTYVQGGDNGTPLQKDEPQAPNPPDGAYIDYYLRDSATTPVTVQILDAGGNVLRTFSSDPNAQQQPAFGGRGGGRGGRGGGIPNVSPLWQTTPEPLPASAGMHRVVWTPVAGGGRGRGRGGAVMLSGNFTAKLTVNGKSYTQPFSVRPAERIDG